MFRFKPHFSALQIIILIVLAVFAGATNAQTPERLLDTASAQTPERFFDTASAPKDNVRLTLFYPSVNTLKLISALKEQGFIPYDNLEIVGVYHVKERTNYADSVRYVRENKIKNVHFHAVSADLSVATIYKKNDATDEFRKIFELSDGIIFFGGPDIPPAAYGEKTDFLTDVQDLHRHYLDLSMIFHLLGGSQNEAFKGFLESRPELPVLGICLGMQSLDVGTGGTMIQDLWSEVYGKKTAEEVFALGQAFWHRNPFAMIAPENMELAAYVPHRIKFLAGGRLMTATGMTAADMPYVGSAHHQAVDTLGKGFKVVATSEDGRIVEVIEHQKYVNVLGVQFHPEYRMLWETKPQFKISPEDPALFAYRPFLEANPPSLEFHKRLWNWFFTKVKGSRTN